MKKKPKIKLIPYQIRIGESLLEKVKVAAEKDERSVNAQIRHFLKEATKESKPKNE